MLNHVRKLRLNPTCCSSLHSQESSLFSLFQQTRYRSSKREQKTKRRLVFDKKNKNGSYYNKSLERSAMTPEELLKEGSNIDLDNIREDSKKRIELRYCEPNKYWIEKIMNLKVTGDIYGVESIKSPYRDNPKTRKLISKQLVSQLGAPKDTITPRDLYLDEVDVGDVIDTGEIYSRNALGVVIGLPVSVDDPRYTILTMFGDIEFISKKKMGFIIPKVFPKDWFKDCIFDESQFIKPNPLTKTYDVTPIGKPKYNIEDDISRDRIFEGFGSQESASYHLNSDIRTYIVPSILTGVISKELTLLNNHAWSNLPNMNLKLELLHNILQCLESPIHLTLFQLYEATKLLDLRELSSQFVSTDPTIVLQVYKSLADKILKQISMKNQFDQLSIGKKIKGELGFDSQINLIDFYTMLLSLKKNSQSYQHRSDSSAHHITVIPSHFIVKFNTLINNSKRNIYFLNNLIEYISYKTGFTNKKVDKPYYYEDIVELLKIYCGASFVDSTLESFVIKVMRSLPHFSNNDISRTLVYELLLDLNEISVSDDPTTWWYEHSKPGSNISAKADLEQEYYDLVDENFKLSNNKDAIPIVNLEYDNVAELRKSFDQDIYCIDDKGAVEVDDGITIEKKSNDEWIVSSVIADPASYLKPDDALSEIAFERGFSLYSPNAQDKNITVFPHGFIKNVEMRKIGEKSVRGLKISFKFNPNTKEITHFIDPKEQFSFVNVDKVHILTYDEVNKVLNNKSDKTYDSKVIEDLKALKIVSESLYQNREQTTNFNILDKDIKKIESREDGSIKIHFDNGLTFEDVIEQQNVKNDQKGFTSSELVAEIMIMTNSIAGSFFDSHKIPAIYRIQNPLPCSENVEKELAEIKENLSKDFTIEEMILSYQFNTKGKVSPLPIKHTSLQIDRYATITSPLRRFGDLINHWQIQSYLKNSCDLQKLEFNQKHINFQALHLSVKDNIIKYVRNRMIGFFIFKALTQLQKSQQNGEKIKFKCYALTRPSADGTLEVVVVNYGIKCTLRTSWYGLDNKEIKEERKELSELEVGDVIDDATIEDIEMFDGTIILRTETY